MVVPAIKRRILEDLIRLTPEEQTRAADLVHGLIWPLPKGASIEDLMKVTGTLDDASARERWQRSKRAVGGWGGWLSGGDCFGAKELTPRREDA